MSTTTTIQFRLSRESDLPLLQRFVDTLYSEDENVSGKRPDVSITFRHLQSHPDKGQLLALEHNGTVCGYAIIIFFWSNEYASNIIEIDELFIDEHHRGTGVGSAFFQWLRLHFKETAGGLSLQVAHKNIKAEKLYERLGFKISRNKHMFKIFD